MTAVTDHSRVQSETPRTYYDELVRIPGYGDAPDRCRPLDPVGYCSHGHVVLGRSSCGTRYCPDHWRDWCEDAVISMVARLAAYRHVRDGWDKRMVHAVASPPTDRRYSVRELWETRSEAYDALEAAGVRGGAVVTHPYRTTVEADRLYSSSGGKEEGTGKWRFLRELVDDLPGKRWDELRGFVEPSPHYHVLAAVEDLDGSRAPDGWVVENIRSFDRFEFDDPEGYKDMAATAYYVLTHGAVSDDRATTTYFGEVHPNSFDVQEELTPSVWRRIQREAEEAVKGYGDEGDEQECSHGPAECPLEGCEAAVRSLEGLAKDLVDPEFVSAVRTLRDGRARLARLRGTLAYWEGRTDRPPPSARRSKGRMREWLEERGRVHTPEPSQVLFGAV